MTTAPHASSPLVRDWHYPADLPVSQARLAVLDALRAHQVTILCGATGSGKSTQLPKFCLEAGLGSRGLIAHTQPRRLAARALAERIASELEETPGQTIGWQVRFKSVLSDTTRVKLMTDGVLLNELRRDRLLRRYDCIIVDEAHERSLNIDFLLGCLKRILPRRPELRLVITSATLDAEKFAAHFDGAPVIEVAGKSHPIDLRYRDPADLDGDEAVARAVQEIWREASGDILVFLPGEREIRELAESLARHPRLQRPAPPEILPLYARLGSARQQRIFQPSGQRRIVLATNVAETSLTVPGIRHVIDTGTARISRYNPRSKVQNLLVENVAQANADQRKGRCGRTAPGICVRLYSEEDFLARPRFAEPEVQRTNLASVLLQMADLDLGDAEDFPFVDAPHRRFLNDARRLLEQLQAFRPDGRLNRIGRQLARLPVDPRFGRILLAARELHVLGDVIPIIAALSMQDPRERDFDQRQKSDQAQAPFRDKSSDFLSLLALWRAARQQKAALSNSEFRRWCQQHYLNARRMQEWRDLVRQIRGDLHALHKDGERAEAIAQESDPEQLQGALVHRALLAGLLDHIGQHDKEGSYRGPRNAHWRIHPESALGRRQPAWIVAAEIVSTRRTYARGVAQVQPQWIEQAAAHLLTRTALEPAWDARRGEVMAREQVSLYGLVLVADRQVPLARFDPQQARHIFIEQALLAGHWGQRRLPAFLQHNRQLMQRLQDEEARQRSRGILRADEAIIAWYDERLPEGICSRRQLLDALGALPDGQLSMGEEDLRDQDAVDLARAYPAELRVGDLRLKLSYIFEPGSAEDGINLDLPLASLNQLPPQPLDWLVPGALPDKLEQLFKALPKQLRRRFVPVGDSVRAALAELDHAEGDLYIALSRWMHRRLGQPGPTAEELRALPLPDRLRMRIRLRDAQGKLIDADRDLDALRARQGQAARSQFRALHDERWERRGLTDWQGPALPVDLTLSNGLRAFPSLRDRGDQVDIVLRDDPEQAREMHRQGLLRLLCLAQAGRLKQRLKSLPERQSVLLRLAALPAADAALRQRLDALCILPDLGGDLPAALAARAVADTQLDEGIRSEEAFRAACEQGAGALAERLQQLWADCRLLAAAWQRWQQQSLPSPDEPARQDMEEQLAWLLAPGWLYRSPRPADLARYLDALCERADKRAQQPAADAQRLSLVAPHWQRCREAVDRCIRQRQPVPQALRDYRWLIEEYRVSVFAQQLGTRQKVSAKRLDQAWEPLRRG